MFGLPIGLFALIKSDAYRSDLEPTAQDVEIGACLQCGVAAMEPDVSYELFLMPAMRHLRGCRTGDRAEFTFRKGVYSLAIGVELDPDHRRPRPASGHRNASPLSVDDALRAAESIVRSAR